MGRLLRALRLGAVLTPALICVCFGCSHRRAIGNRPLSPTDSVGVVLAVTNHHFLDVTIYIEHDGQSTRVGTITAASSGQFILPWRLLGVSRQSRLLGEAIGSPEYALTETLMIQPGQYIEWTLEHDMRHSSVGVF